MTIRITTLLKLIAFLLLVALVAILIRLNTDNDPFRQIGYLDGRPLYRHAATNQRYILLDDEPPTRERTPADEQPHQGRPRPGH